MHFCDEVQMECIAGKGGGGCVGFRREKYAPKGGPDGGDGGKGGSLILQVDKNVNTLSEFAAYKIFRAKSGDQGMGGNMHGKNAEDLILKVPPGTTVYDENKKNIITDLREKGETFIVARGGKGGYGNAHFSTSTRQTPSFAELGEPGEQVKVILELKLVSDVGIIGLPSVGKSSLISRISSARPKIADYPFTTIVPNLGVVYLSTFGGEPHESMVVCDLPGLIEGAHQGKGLGIQFLKHIARNRVLLHLLDGSRENLQKDYEDIRKELGAFDPELLKKPEIIAINKIDLLDAKIQRQKQREVKNAHPVSCATGEGIAKLIQETWQILQKIPKPPPLVEEKEEYKIFRPHSEDEHAFEVFLNGREGEKQIFEVRGKRMGQVVVMTDFRNPEAMQRLYDVLNKMHIRKELARQGAKEGDIILIRGKKIIFHEYS